MRDDVILLLRSESFRVLLSCANEGFCYLNLAGITKFEYERKNKKDSGRSSKITPSCKGLLSERTLNIHPPFVVSVTMLIINIYKSRAVTLFLIKHCIQIRRRFNCKKSLYVMYNRPFDRSMGLRIISEFLKHR